MELKIYDPYKKNATVTKEYILTIAKGFENAGYSISFIDQLTKQEKNNSVEVLVVAVKDATKAKKMKYKKIYCWVQGIVPEESYMRHRSKLRFYILSHIEKEGLKSSDFIFYVSDAMKKFFLNKYNYNNNKYYIMPCFNTEIEKSSFFEDDKYKKNLFLYAGGLDPWQCFEKTAALFKKIEDVVPDSEIRVLTKQKEDAENILKKYDIKRYSIDFKDFKEMKLEMSKAKFGFSLREKHPVNYVSTPTKLSTYTSYGVIPIYSKNVDDFANIVKEGHFVIRSDEDNEYGFDKIIELCNEDIKAEEVYSEFQTLFGKYYNKEYHIKQIADVILRK